MKRIIEILFIVSLIFYSGDINSQSITWEKIYINPEAQYSNGINSICESDSGNYFLIGYTLILSQPTHFKICVTKINSYGETLWIKTFGRNGTEGITAVSTGDGGCVISGRGGGAYTIKIDRDGNLIWEKYYGGAGVRSMKIIKTTDGGFIACGLYDLKDGYIFKIDSSGNFNWHKIDKSNYVKCYFDIIPDYNLGFTTCGYEIESSQDTAHAVVINVNESGTIFWEKKIYLNDQNTAYCIEKFQNGYIIAGSIGNVPITTGKVYFLKMDVAGNHNNPVILKNTATEYFGDFKVINENKFVFISSKDSVNTVMPGKSVITDSSGNVLNQRIFPTSDFIDFKSILLLKNGDFIFTGTAGFYIPGSDQVGYAVRTDSLLNYKTIGIEENNSVIPENFKLYQNYPNPFNPATTISFSLPQASYVKLKVFDAAGREIKELINEYRQRGNYEVKFDGSNLPSGIYFYRLAADDFTAVRRMILLK